MFVEQEKKEAALNFDLDADEEEDEKPKSLAERLGTKSPLAGRMNENCMEKAVGS